MLQMAELFAVKVFSDLDRSKKSTILTQDQLLKLRILTICTIALNNKSPISYDTIAKELELETDEAIESTVIKGAKIGAFRSKINQSSRTITFTDIYVRDGSDRTPEALKNNLNKL